MRQPRNYHLARTRRPLAGAPAILPVRHALQRLIALTTSTPDRGHLGRVTVARRAVLKLRGPQLAGVVRCSAEMLIVGTAAPHEHPARLSPYGRALSGPW